MFRLTTTLALLLALTPACAAEARIIVQQAPLAGFQYDGKVLWEAMKIGDALTLVREPQNPHDANAVRVDWKGQPLGYVPRRENSDVARQMDRGAPVQVRIVRLKEARNPWQRIEFGVYVERSPTKPRH